MKNEKKNESDETSQGSHIQHRKNKKECFGMN